MTEFESLIVSKLSQIESDTAASKASLAAMNERLFDGPSSVISTLQGDIIEIKDDRKRDEKWERIHNILHYSLTPIAVALHSIARHLGVNV